VKEVIEQNKRNVKPMDLRDFAERSEPAEKKLDYADVVGQDSLTRMDKKKKKKKKKKSQGSQQGGNNQQGKNQQGQRGPQGPRPPRQPAK
jgi:hypothetical protein